MAKGSVRGPRGTGPLAGCGSAIAPRPTVVKEIGAMFRSRLWTLGLAALCLAPGRLAADPPAPAPDARPFQALDPEALAARIDHLLGVRLAEKGTKPAPLADDAEFMRRLALDLTGRIPKVGDLRDFLEDKSPEKRR